jgi:hypothetical protein
MVHLVPQNCRVFDSIFTGIFDHKLFNLFRFTYSTFPIFPVDITQVVTTPPFSRFMLYTLILKSQIFLEKKITNVESLFI